jgi:hypothetical protein
MTDTGSFSYSPQRRTALVLTGTGADGAYHAGVLRALHEAGVKLDIIGARGVGIVGALFAAVDGGQRLWEEKGFWRGHATHALYPWGRVPTVVAWALAVSVAIVATPLIAAALGLVVFPIDFLLKMIGVGGAPGLLGAYLRLMTLAFAPDALPTWLPRFVLLVLGSAAAVALVQGWIAGGRHMRGALWWHAVPGPLSSREIVERCWRVMWDLIRGATPLKSPSPSELGRRYTEMLAENIGQPGFRELVFVVHDVDAHRDLVFALVAESRRRQLIRRATIEAADTRRAEVFDLAGIARDHLADAVAAALTLPLASDWHTVTFASDGYWRGETHRICDRPAGSHPARRRTDRPGRRAADRRVGSAAGAGSAHAGGGAARWTRPARRLPAVHRSRRRQRRHQHLRRRAHLHHSAGAQSDRAVRLCRRLRRPVAPAPRSHRARERRLRRRVSPVHRAGRRRQRRPRGQRQD